MLKKALREAIANRLITSKKFQGGEYTLYAEVPVSALKPTSMPFGRKTVIDEVQYANQTFDLLICKNRKAVLSITIGKYSDVLSRLLAIHFRGLPHMFADLNELKSDEEQIEQACDEVLAAFYEKADKNPPNTYSLRPQRPVAEAIPKEAGIAKEDIPRLLIERGLIQQNGTPTVYGSKAHLFYRYDGGSIRAPTLVSAESGRVVLIGALIWNDGEWNKSLEARLSHVKRAIPSDEAFVDKLAEYLEELLDMPLDKYYATIGNKRKQLDRLLSDKALPYEATVAATYYDVIRICHRLRNTCETCTDTLEREHLEAVNRALLCELSKPLFDKFHKLYLKSEDEQAEQMSESDDQSAKRRRYVRKVPELAKASVREQLKPPKDLPQCFMLASVPLSYYYHAASRRSNNGYANAIFYDMFGTLNGSKGLSVTLQSFLNYFAYIMPTENCSDEDNLPYLLAMLVDPICQPFDLKKNQNNQKGVN